MNAEKPAELREHIKVNFPLTEEDYLNGNGEGMWVMVDEATKEAYDRDASGSGYIGILDNDSLYYPGLNHGEVIPFEMRGEYRPVADYYNFLSRWDKISEEMKDALLAHIAGGCKGASGIMIEDGENGQKG